MKIIHIKEKYCIKLKNFKVCYNFINKTPTNKNDVNYISLKNTFIRYLIFNIC